MRSFVTSALLVSSSVAAASLAPRWDWPEAMPLVARQDPGTPRYQCHEDCGTSITLSREEGYCTNADWRGRYDACMICANTEEIWMYYRGSVVPAAAACGLTAEPSPSGWAPEPEPSTTAAPVEPSTTEAPVEPSTTEAPVDPVSSAQTTPGVSSVSAPAGPTSSSAPVDPVTSDEPLTPSSTEAPVEQPTSSDAPVDPVSSDEPVVASSSAVVPPEASSSVEVPAGSSSAAAEESASSGASYPEETSSCSDDATATATPDATASEPCETDSAGVPTGKGEPTTLVTKTTEGADYVAPTKGAESAEGPAPPAQTPVTDSPVQEGEEATEVPSAPVVVESADATEGSIPAPSHVEVSGAGKAFGSIVAAGVAAVMVVAAC